MQRTADCRQYRFNQITCFMRASVGLFLSGESLQRRWTVWSGSEQSTVVTTTTCAGGRESVVTPVFSFSEQDRWETHSPPPFLCRSCTSVLLVRLCTPGSLFSLFVLTILTETGEVHWRTFQRRVDPFCHAVHHHLCRPPVAGWDRDHIHGLPGLLQPRRDWSWLCSFSDRKHI